MIETTDNYLGTTKDGYEIYDRKDSHIQNKSGVTKELLSIAFKRMYANGANFKKKEIHFSGPIGFNQCLETTEADEIIMVYRKGRQGMTPMVKGRTPNLSNTLTVIIKRDEKIPNRYNLITCYIGESSLREPWDKSIRTQEELKASETYWKTHALVYDQNAIDWNRM